MTKPSITQSQKRFQESIGALFSKERQSSKKCLFIKSSTDTGVIRNGGRNGARFAPQSFLSTFKKFSQSDLIKDWSFQEFEVSDQALEIENFHNSQLLEAEKISSIISSSPESAICHLGGGHDHIFPLLTALSGKFKSVIVINIDAHADTRTDDEFHSGTPFRQFANNFEGHFKLYQIGLHPFANSFSTLSPFGKGQMDVLWKKDLNEVSLQYFFKQISKDITPDTLVVFSLDADAVNGSDVPGVSAVNPAGLTREELLSVWKQYRTLTLNHSPVMGIYELNPVYDTLASISMRSMGSFVFEALMI